MDIWNGKRIGALAVSGLLSLSLLFAACGSNDDDDSTNDDEDSSTPSATTAPANTPTASPSNDNDGDATPDDGNGDDDDNDDNDDEGSPLDRLREAAQAGNPTTYRLVYEMVMEDQTVTLTMAARPPDRMIKITDSSGGTDDVLVIIEDGESSFFCSSGDGGGQCIKSAGETSPFGSLDDFLVVDAGREIQQLAEETGVTVERTGDRTIAGDAAECYRYTSEDGDGDLCISKARNIVLLIDAISPEGDVVRMEVVDYSDSPSDADFEPPYPVIDFG